MTDSELTNHFETLISSFSGDIPELIQAIGAYHVGKIYGYRVLRIIISSRIHTRHEKILGIKFKDYLPESTPFSHRSVGYYLAVKLDKFWDIVHGRHTVPTKEKFLFTD